MNRASKLALVSALLRSETTLTLATANAEGMANAAPLFFYADDIDVLYWLSSSHSLHSRNLLREPKACVAIYSHADHWKQIRGMQMQGTVSCVTEATQRTRVIHAYSERFQLGAMFQSILGLSTLYAFSPVHLRYVDNSRHFGFCFELDISRPVYPAVSERERE